MSEDRATREKRLRIRSWRRGTREMDMILGPFCDAELSALDDATLDTYEALLAENDQDLYRWVSGQDTPPERFGELLARIGAFAETANAVR